MLSVTYVRDYDKIGATGRQFSISLGLRSKVCYHFRNTLNSLKCATLQIYLRHFRFYIL